MLGTAEQRHAAAAAMTVAEMHHPVGDDFFRRARQIVHENHHEHHKPAQRIYGNNAFRFKRNETGIGGHAQTLPETGFAAIIGIHFLLPLPHDRFILAA